MSSETRSWEELIEALKEEFSAPSVEVDRVKEVMLSYRSCEKDWKRFANFDPFRYTRNLVEEGNDLFNLIVICWGEGQGSSIHDHSNCHCFMKILSGGLLETLYDWPSGDTGQQQASALMVTAQHNYARDQVTYISDEIGLHRVENSSHSEPAVSLHLYSPPFSSCQSFDERSGTRNVCRVVFHSKCGRKCPPL